MVDIDSGSDLPEDGTVVRAMRYESMEYDRAPYEVTGRLLTRPSPFGPPPQCWVDGVQVDPSSIQAVQAADSPGTDAIAPETPPAGP